MSTTELHFQSLEQVAILLGRKKLSPVELVDSILARIVRLNPRLNAYISVVGEQARAQARTAEREIFRRRYRGSLHGVPVALKDNICTRGVRTTAGSKILADFVPDADATVARRLARAGAILIGKTNLHEFAYGVTTENPHYGSTRNPWAQDRIPGGSSGGSAAALAAGMCFGSVGTDTGGSIRIPASLCGIVGLKPTFGRVSCAGVVPLARTLDHTGPLARSVTDVAILLRAIAGRDALDPSTARAGVPDYPHALRGRLGRLRLGWPEDYFFERTDEEVLSAVESAARQLEKLGAKIEKVALPKVSGSEEPSNRIALAEARQYHERMGYFPARAAEYGEDVRKRLDAGRDVAAVDYLQALEARRQSQAEFEAAFRRVDAILAPTTPVAAPRLGEKLITLGGEQESVRAALIRLNRPANFTGLPAISIPCGFTRGELPIGLQLIGRPWEEARLLQIALAYERATEWHTRHPRE
jgi:aspartyl-tRNA(Asn)/glutamyl-tRNA(Gln) amidotransferase subunit A